MINMQSPIKPEDAEEMEFEQINEPWLQYKVSDGTVVEARLMVVSIKKALNPIDPSNPFYFANWAGVVRIKRKKDVPSVVVS